MAEPRGNFGVPAVYDATTDASGNYTITGAAAGSYELTAADCDGSSRDDISELGPSLTLAPSQAAIGVNIQLAAGTSISGHVYAGSGTSTPLASVCVSVSGASDFYGAETDLTGAYTVAHLKPGTPFTVQFDPDCIGSGGTGYAEQYYDGASELASATTVTPTVADPASGIDGHLVAGGSISGTVSDANGLPITSEDICVSASGAGSGSTITTDASGHYTITGLTAGSYSVSAADCYLSSRNDLTGSYGSGVTLASGQAVTGIDIEMPAATSIGGHVYGGSGTGTPLAGVCVDVYDRSMRSPRLHRVHAERRLLHGQGPPARGRLHRPVPAFVLASGKTYLSQYYGGSTSATATPIVPTVASPATAIDAHLSPGGSVSGQVTDANGNPITSADICITAESPGGACVLLRDVRQHGCLHGVGPAHRDLLAHGGRTATTALATTCRRATTTSRSPRAQAATTLDIEMPAGTSISGYVYAGAGTLVPAAGGVRLRRSGRGSGPTARARAS